MVTDMLTLMACMSIMPSASSTKCPYRLGQHEQLQSDRSAFPSDSTPEPSDVILALRYASGCSLYDVIVLSLHIT